MKKNKKVLFALGACSLLLGVASCSMPGLNFSQNENGDLTLDMTQNIPYIGENGNWWINGSDTGVAATGSKGEAGEKGETGEKGEDGKNGLDGADGKDGVDGVDGKDGKDGVDGVDGLDGADGKDGEDGKTPYIGENGNWWIGDTDTGITAGVEENYQGKSAYDLFMEQHPEYTGDEAQWITDLLNGLFFDLSTFTVTFEDGSGNVYDALTINILSGQAIVKPADPVKSGWIFTGWYNKTTNEKWSFTANVVLGNITLVAHWVRSSEQPTCYFQNINADAYGVSFNLHHNEIAVPQNIAIYDGNNGEMIESTLDMETTQFNGLLASHYYRLEVTYAYDLNDGLGERTKTASSRFYTSGLNTPSFHFNSISADKTKITFDCWENDYDNIGEIKSIDLYKLGDTTPTASLEDLTVREFTGLLANTTYTIKIVYEYDLNDGAEVRSTVYENTVTTGAYRTPTVSFANKKVTQNQISGNVRVEDPDGIDTIESITLWLGDTKVGELDIEDLSVMIGDLNENSQYTLKIEHSYDLLDGTGEKTETLEVSCRTHPVYQLTDTTILNTSAILEGDTVVIHAVVDNPSGSRFTKAKINGEYYSVDASSTSTNVYVTFAAPESGDVEYTITELVAELDDEEFIFYTSESNHASTKVYNRLSVDTFTGAVYNSETEQFEERDYFFPSDDIYAKVTLNNPEGYDVDSMNINGTVYSGDQLIEISSEEYAVKTRDGYLGDDSYWNYGSSTYYVSSITYSIGEITKTAQYSNKSARISRLGTNEITEISSAEDFASIGANNNDGWKYYKLTDDLDMSSIGQWISRDFHGVLDGNGKTISNLNFVDTFENVNCDFGLFRYVYGSLKDLTFSNCATILTFKSPSSDSAYYGFIGYRIEGNIKNVTIDDSCSVSLTFDCASNDFYAHIGGLVSYLEGCVDGFVNSANMSFAINTNGSAHFYGGAVSYYAYSPTIIRNAAYTGNISYTNGRSGGCFYGEIFGLNREGNATIENSYSTGLINNRSVVNLTRNDSSLKNCANFATTKTHEVLDWSDKTYHFDTDGGSVIQDVVAPCVSNLPTPEKEGYCFYGWYDNPEFEGAPVTQYYSQDGGTLYARWLEIEDDYSALVTKASNYDNQYLFTTGADGKIYSPKASETSKAGDNVSSSYKITADRDMLINYDFSISSKNYTTWADIYKYNSNGDQYCLFSWGGYSNYSGKYAGSIELKAGESVSFRISLGYLSGNSGVEGYEAQMIFDNLEVCYF